MLLPFPFIHRHHHLRHHQQQQRALFACHTNTYSIAKAMFRNQNYNTGQLRYFDNIKTSLNTFYELYIDKVIRRIHQFIDQTVYR